MIAIKNKLDWIDSEDHAQCEWAINYLIQRGYQMINPGGIYPSQHAVALEYGRRLADTAEVRELVRRMKNTWSQKKYRASLKGKKTFSFLMSSTTDEKLVYLSKKLKKPKNEVLERLISEFESTIKLQRDLKNMIPRSQLDRETKKKNAALLQNNLLTNFAKNLIEEIAQFRAYSTVQVARDTHSNKQRKQQHIDELMQELDKFDVFNEQFTHST